MYYNVFDLYNTTVIFIMMRVMFWQVFCYWRNASCWMMEIQRRGQWKELALTDLLLSLTSAAGLNWPGWWLCIVTENMYWEYLAQTPDTFIRSLAMAVVMWYDVQYSYGSLAGIALGLVSMSIYLFTVLDCSLLLVSISFFNVCG